MKLFIAEKPSMARELAKCLPDPHQRGNGCIRTGGGIVTWAYGHVLQQAEPQDYDPKYKRWNADDLPIIPKQWKLLVSLASKDQFKVITDLIANPDVDTIVNAGDPDREGQLLIDEILDYVGNKKPVERILLNALDEKSIHESLDDLRSNGDFVHLKESALARSRADWLIGMNLSRAYTLAARRQGHRVVFPIGRVKTPTLALVVRREAEIKDFYSKDFYELVGTFLKDNIPFKAKLVPDDTLAVDEEGRILQPEILEAIKEKALAVKYADNKAAGEKYLAENKGKEGVVTTPSGLQYKIITKGTGAIPADTSKVKVNYKGTLIDGTEFDSSYKRNEPATFRANQVIKGWTEALTMMPVGSKWELYIPQELGYGGRETGGQIKPFSTLIFEVELVGIEK